METSQGWGRGWGEKSSWGAPGGCKPSTYTFYCLSTAISETGWAQGKPLVREKRGSLGNKCQVELVHSASSPSRGGAGAVLQRGSLHEPWLTAELCLMQHRLIQSLSSGAPQQGCLRKSGRKGETNSQSSFKPSEKLWKNKSVFVPLTIFTDLAGLMAFSNKFHRLREQLIKVLVTACSNLLWGMLIIQYPRTPRCMLWNRGS